MPGGGGVLGGPDDIQTAWKLLAGGAPTAAAALVDIAENGKSEIARVQASTAILDRVGLATPKERPQVTFAVIPKEFDQAGITQQISPAEVIRSRLKELQAAAGHAPGYVQPDGEQPEQMPAWAVAVSSSSGDDSEPIDAEIVDDDDGDWMGNSNPWQ